VVDTRARLEALYRRYAPLVFRRARRLLGSDEEAHEVVQDVFLAIFEQPGHYEGRSSLTTYLYSASTHACLKRIARQRNRSRLIAAHVAPFAAGKIDGALTQERLYLLHELLARMPVPLARVVVYAHVDDLTHDEIARILGCSRRQVGKLLERATAWARFGEESAC
jgi:RNA polymerase sigma factor (sigma-70 family)